MTNLPLHYRFESFSTEDAVSIICLEFRAISETPKGYWVVSNNLPHWFSDRDLKKHRKFVLKKSMRRFCYPTKQEALQSFAHRKVRQLQYIAGAKRVAERSLKIAERVLDLAPDEIETIKDHVFEAGTRLFLT